MLQVRTARKLLPIVAFASYCAIAVMPAPVRADSLPGFTLFSGVEPADRLSYRLNSGNRNSTDSYRLTLPGTKINRLGAAQIQITYPEYYKGKFDDKAVEIFVDDKAIPVQAVEWDRENRMVNITLEKQLKTRKDIQVVLNNVQNPDNGGMYNFTAQVRSSTEFPLARYVGTWTLSID
jgi:Protein of unknown function (DUF2808)